MESAKKCEDAWAKFHEKALPYEQAINQEPFRTLIDTILSFVREHDLTGIFETGFGTGYVLKKLSGDLGYSYGMIGGIDASEILVERARDLCLEVEAGAYIGQGDIFDDRLYRPQHDLIYHQGLLEHLPDNKIKELLRLQAANSFAVIFSVPSKFYGKQDFGDERLLTLQEWKKILAPFEIYQLRYYDDNRHILGILKGGLYE